MLSGSQLGQVSHLWLYLHTSAVLVDLMLTSVLRSIAAKAGTADVLDQEGWDLVAMRRSRQQIVRFSITVGITVPRKPFALRRSR